jgi:crossover junction endodeoxyribonuclease RusA
MIHLPYPPSINRLYRSINGRSILSKIGRDYYRDVVPLAEATGINIRGPYVLTITAHRPDRRKRDIGNLEKIVSDTLTKAGVIEDDSLCEAIISTWACSGLTITAMADEGARVPVIHVQLGEEK